MNASEILVVILAAALAIFLILGIILLVVLIRVARQIQAVTASAKNVVDHVEGIVSTVGRAAAPAIASKFVLEQIQRIAERFNKKK